MKKFFGILTVGLLSAQAHAGIYHLTHVCEFNTSSLGALQISKYEKLNAVGYRSVEISTQFGTFNHSSLPEVASTETCPQGRDGERGVGTCSKVVVDLAGLDRYGIRAKLNIPDYVTTIKFYAYDDYSGFAAVKIEGYAGNERERNHRSGSSIVELETLYTNSCQASRVHNGGAGGSNSWTPTPTTPDYSNGSNEPRPVPGRPTTPQPTPQPNPTLPIDDDGGLR